MAEISRMQALFSSFDRLSTREKALVGGLGLAFITTLTVIIWIIIGSQIDTLEQRNDNMRDTISQVNTLKENFLRQKERIDAIKERLESNTIRLVQVMETEAGNRSIQIEDFKESKRNLTNTRRQFRRRGNDSEKKTVKELIEESQTVTIRRVSLEDLVSFMSALETRQEPVKVTNLTVSTLNSDRQILREIRMTVSTYRYEEVEI